MTLISGMKLGSFLFVSMESLFFLHNKYFICNVISSLFKTTFRIAVSTMIYEM